MGGLSRYQQAHTQALTMRTRARINPTHTYTNTRTHNTCTHTQPHTDPTHQEAAVPPVGMMATTTALVNQRVVTTFAIVAAGTTAPAPAPMTVVWVARRQRTYFGVFHRSFCLSWRTVRWSCIGPSDHYTRPHPSCDHIYTRTRTHMRRHTHAHAHSRADKLTDTHVRVRIRSDQF